MEDKSRPLEEWQRLDRKKLMSEEPRPDPVALQNHGLEGFRKGFSGVHSFEQETVLVPKSVGK